MSERAIEAIKAVIHPVASWFLDRLGDGLLGRLPTRAYHHTAPVNALYGLHQSLSCYSKRGWRLLGVVMRAPSSFEAGLRHWAQVCGSRERTVTATEPCVCSGWSG